jgi:hypothetical protein
MQRKVCDWKTATRQSTRHPRVHDCFNLREMGVMHHKTVLVAGLGVLALMVCAGASQADGRKAARTAALTAGEHKAVYYRKRATRVRGYFAMRGGYAYGRSDVTSTYGPSRPPYAVVDQSPGGPFDSGFFFDSGITPLNNAPYPR